MIDIAISSDMFQIGGLSVSFGGVILAWFLTGYDIFLWIAVIMIFGGGYTLVF